MTWAPDSGPRPTAWAAPEPVDGLEQGAPPGHLTAPDTADLPTLEFLRVVGSGPRGLLESQADDRLARYGENVLPALRSVSWPRRFLRSLRDPFTTVLFCLALVSAAVAAWNTACVIMALVTVSCVLRSSGEYRADQSASALRELVAATATVRRRADANSAPETREIPVDQLVPGDVVLLGPGDLVPADLRLLRATGLTVHQAALTGESAPVAKYPVESPGPTGDASPASDEEPGDGASGDRRHRHGSSSAQEAPHLCLQGSSVASGSATGVVTATGEHTRFARGFRGMSTRRRESAFDRSVHGISWSLIRFMLLTPPLVLMADAGLRGRGLETLPFAVAVAVGLTPEMLPVVVTTTLARGASLLARGSDVIVKRLPALHDLGAMDVLCTDKTGTLTQDRPVVACHVDGEGHDSPDVLHWAAVNSLWTLQLAELPSPDALDEALLDAAEERGDDLDHDAVAALPFDPVRRLATVVLRTPGSPGTHALVVKGAAEAVIARCVRQRVDGRDTDLDDEARARLLSMCAQRAEGGLRVLAVAAAERPAKSGASSVTASDEYGLTFLGVVGLRDAAADTAADALTALSGRGVTVKVLTGDHPGTAARACDEIGLDPGLVVTGDTIDGLDDDALAELAETTTVFARCTPAHKARVVRALRAGGHVTGFLGDGVNDLPALHAADVGISPRDATAVAREAADVVLAAKDLTAICHAIVAGRRSSGNIATYLRIALSSNLGNVIAMLTAGLLLPFLPMLPMQVLVQNLCFDGAQLAFAYDRPPAADMARPSALEPRAILRFVTGFGILNAIADVATFGILALSIRGFGTSASQEAFQSGWFTENLLTQALVMLLLRTGRTAAEGRAPGPIRLTTSALAAIGILVPLSPLAPALGFTALPLFYYALLAAVLMSYGTALVMAKTRYEARTAARQGLAASKP
ncbi:magnesium-translocating P-type ATPase [Streptomyces sp. NPDC087422]|uniref:magnesium-translocating P-type ATPase n=1 Tax=Streptomyces sp. NPDC087422 TaxID=3365786 RepID=UPI00381E7351